MELLRLKKRLISTFLIFSLINLGFTGLMVFKNNSDNFSASAEIITVNDDGGANYFSIQAAIDNASSGDTVNVWAGIYYENIVINKRITLIGNGTNETKINGKRNGDVVKITTDRVNISGFSIINSGNQDKPFFDSGIELNGVKFVHIEDINSTNNYYGIFLNNSDSNTIINTTCTNNTIVGINLENSESNNIINTTCSFNEDTGIGMSYSNLNAIMDTTCSNNRESGVLIGYSESNKIINNTIRSNGRFGIYIVDSNSTVVLNNTMISQGLMVDDESFKLAHWNTHTIRDNTINGRPVIYWKNKTGGKIPSGAGQVILANCTNVIVEEQNFSNVSFSVFLGFSNNNIIRNNSYNFIQVGIWLKKSDMNAINGNTFMNNENGILIMFSNSNTIANNKFNLNSINSIRVLLSDSNIINNNIILNNYNGLFLFKSESNIIINNTVTNSNFLGIHLDKSNFNVISNNICAWNKWYGIYFDQSNQNTVEFNNISNNKNGIYFKGSSKNIVKFNNISYNKIGINLTGSDNYIYRNNIISNKRQAIDNGVNRWYYLGEGNYWSDYTGLDNGSGNRVAGNGIGDTDIPHLGLDHYPFINFSGWLNANYTKEIPIYNNSEDNGSLNETDDKPSKSDDENLGWSDLRITIIIFIIILVIFILVINRKKKPAQDNGEPQQSTNQTPSNHSKKSIK